MQLPFVDRSPTSREVQKPRLILSAYQDGTGQLAAKGHLTLPGWRDFERSVALAFGGEAQESKAIFDVLLPDLNREGIQYGLSCKMRETLRHVERTGRVTIEVSNSAGKFWTALKADGFSEDSYESAPGQVGKILVRLVESWHAAVSIESGGKVDLTGSFYLALQWDKSSGYYQLYQFPIGLPNPETIRWKVISRRLVGDDGNGTLFEWYGFSGGQLKYYPLAAEAAWTSDRFQLEPLPKSKVGVLRRVAEYFPEAWAKACEEQ
jgi:hypothetical protein